MLTPCLRRRSLSTRAPFALRGWWLLWICWLIACTPARRELDGDLVRRIQFEGNEGAFSGQNDLQLRAAMEQKTSPWFTFTWPFMYFNQPVRLDLDTVALDVERLRIWYAHRGWFDMKFDGWAVRRVRLRRDDRAGVVDLIGHLRPGEPSIVQQVRVKVEGAGAVVARGALRRVPVAEGAQFSLLDVDAARVNVVEELQENGFAYGKAEAKIDVWPDKHAVDVELEVVPGIQARFGELKVEGAEAVPEAIVRDSLRFTPYDPDDPASHDAADGKFSLSRLRESQQRIFDTGFFSIVDVEPDLSDPTQQRVPVTVRVSEAKFRRFRLGAGVQFDYFNLSPQLNLSYRDVRFAGSSLRLDALAAVGAVIGVVNDDAGGTDLLITGLGELRFEYPWLMRRKLGLGGGLRFEQGAQFGSLPYWEIGADFKLRRALGRYASFVVGPKFKYFQYNGGGVEELASLQFGGDFNGSNYRLLTFDLGWRLDTRNDTLNPTSGGLGTLDLRQSLPIPTLSGEDLENAFLYTELAIDLRRWWRYSGSKRLPPMVFAGRLQGKVMVPWGLGGAYQALPYPELGFLGGPNSLRGFRSNQVGPYDAVCVYGQGRPFPMHNDGEPYDVDTTFLPQGGALSLQASAEARVEWRYGVSFALFGDVGLLARRAEDLATGDVVRDMLRYDGGVGLRYASPIGPIRLDIGLRPLFVEDLEGARNHINCNHIDHQARPYDLVSAFRNERRTERDPFPMAINLFLAIGEAF